MVDKKKTFTVKVGDKELKLAVVRPDAKVEQNARLAFNGAFKNAVKPADGKPGSMLRASLNQVLRDQKLWDDVKEAKYAEVTGRLNENTRKLKAGGIKLKEAKEIAIQMRGDRYMLGALSRDRNQLDMFTAEAAAEQAKFDYIVSACTVFDDTGKPYFKNEDDYKSKVDDPAGAEAANIVGRWFYGLEDDFEKKLPENVFLLSRGYCNNDLALINKAGERVDTVGRRVNKEGQLINLQGQAVDEAGNLLGEDGEVVVEFKPFLDDEAEPTAGLSGEAEAVPATKELKEAE